MGKKVTIKQLAKILMEEKSVLATHPGGEEGTEGYEKDVLSRSWGGDEEVDPELDFVDESRWSKLAGIHEQSLPQSATAKKWMAWAEGYGLQMEEDNEGQILFYFDLNDDVDGSIQREAEEMGGAIEPAGYPADGNMAIYTDEYVGGP